MPDVGDGATATLAVSPFSGSTAATLLVTAPDSSTSGPSTSTSDGGATWTAAVTYSQSGWYLLKWTVTGTGAGIEYQQVFVSGAPTIPATTPLVASIEDFKQWLRYGTNTDKDEEMLLCLGSASEWVKWRLSGPLKVETFTERVWCNGCYIQQSKHPLVSVVSITPQDGTALSASSYIVDTTNGQIEMRYGAYGWHTIVYTAGMPAIRQGVKLAGMEVAKHLWQVLNGSTGRGRAPEDLVPTPMGFAVPARAEELISADPDNDLMPGFA